MVDREKVIQKLEKSLKEMRANRICIEDVIELEENAVDALILLKEQEPRVMTWDEMIAAGKEGEAVFVEECPKGEPNRRFWGIAFPGMEPPKDAPFNYPGGVDFNVTDVDGDIWDGDFYNMNAPLGWRAWTSRPTPEQMRDTPWEEMP